MPFQLKNSVKAINSTFLYPWAEFAIGRVCNGPRLLRAEFVMGRDVLEPKNASHTPSCIGVNACYESSALSRSFLSSS